METLVLACTDYDASTAVCNNEQWISQPGLLPPLPAADGAIISAAMITVCATAWCFKYVRRFIAPRS